MLTQELVRRLTRSTQERTVHAIDDGYEKGSQRGFAIVSSILFSQSSKDFIRIVELYMASCGALHFRVDFYAVIARLTLSALIKNGKAIIS